MGPSSAEESDIQIRFPEKMGNEYILNIVKVEVSLVIYFYLLFLIPIPGVSIFLLKSVTFYLSTVILTGTPGII